MTSMLGDKVYCPMCGGQLFQAPSKQESAVKDRKPSSFQCRCRPLAAPQFPGAAGEFSTTTEIKAKFIDTTKRPFRK